MTKRNYILLGFIFVSNILFAQKATITKSYETFKTYAFSDPDPVARITKHYPYYRFDGFTNTPEEQKWTIITLENDYIKVFVAPEIGGKVLGAIEKSTGEEFIYYNKVVKFRDIAMRGAWTSGGIEFNFGTIGHAPTTASPVNYLLQENSDGSVSCFVGAPDITSRTEWRVEIRLQPDKSFFETNAIWYNPSDLKTSMYNWMTASVDASDDLEYYFPGTTQIGHDGDAYSWPVTDKGIDISAYKNNNFGGNKSYHVLGEYAEHFLCYFRNKEFGLGHWSPYDEKPGQKIWLWALSREGAIWTDLLTDKENIQYTEIQTGLLFNQAAVNSGQTPYKHLFLDEGTEQKFTELWFPVKGIGGMVKADEYGSLNVEQNGKEVKIGFCANQEISDELVITVDDKEVVRKKINLKPTEVFIESLSIENYKNIQLEIGNVFSFNTKEKEERVLSKSIEIDEDFDWESVDGIFTTGIEMERQRNFKGAKEEYEKVLLKDPFHTEALTGLAGLYYRSMDYEKAREYALKALSNNTYDPGANYIFGIISKRLGKKYDALDAFALASRSMQYRSIAKSQMASIFFVEGDMQKSIRYSDQALEYNSNNINALKIKTLALEKMGSSQKREKALNEIIKIDPLNSFARFEKEDDFLKVLNYEMPHEICLEQAIWYFKLGLNEKAVQILNATEPNPIINYWLAYILQDQKHIAKAVSASINLVYPSRDETAEVLQWAAVENDSWKTKYYLALIYWSKDLQNEAKQKFKECGDQPEDYAFYLTRFNLLNGETSYDGEPDLKKAWKLNQNEWRIYKELSNYYEVQQQYGEALDWAKNGASKFPDNYVLSYQFAKNLLISGKYQESLKVLTNTTILPNEGASSGRVTYRQACVLDALNKLQKNNNKSAFKRINQAREWPENLGVGKPYDTDERIEDYLESLYWMKNQSHSKAKELKERVIKNTLKSSRYSSTHYLGALALRQIGKKDEARKLLSEWKEKEPNSLIASWCLSKFNGEDDEAKKLFVKIKKENNGTLFNPKSKDAAFALVLAISELE